MVVTDQIKILDRKVMQNEAQDNFDRKTAANLHLSNMNIWQVKICVLSQALLNRLNSSILYWGKCLIGG